MTLLSLKPLTPCCRSKYALGDLLDLFTQHAPKLRHLKLEDYGNMATPIAIETWPSAHSVTELELVATIPRGEPGENPKSLITEVSRLER